MSGLKNSPFGKRLRQTRPGTTPGYDSDDEDSGPRRIRARTVPTSSASTSAHPPIFGIGEASTSQLSLTGSDILSRPGSPTLYEPGLAASTSTSSSVSASSTLANLGEGTPGRGRTYYGDRFVPSRDGGDMRAAFNLLDDGPSTPRRPVIPTDNDALKDRASEQANNLFTSILHTEIAPSSPASLLLPARASSPARAHSSGSSSRPSATPQTPDRRRRIFAYASPGGPSSISGLGGALGSETGSSRRLDDPTDEIYSLSPIRSASRAILASPRQRVRSVQKTPYRVLDAPELADDFYLNLVDWSATNVLGVGLGTSVYLWTAHTAAVSKLCNLAGGGDTISSVAWTQAGSQIAIGTMQGRIHIYDASTLQPIRVYNSAHSARIGALAWTAYVLSSGSRDRTIHHRDVREPSQKPWKRSVGHKQEVCGLKWSGDGAPSAATLASGGNDNKVCIWDLRGSRRAAAGATSGAAGLAPGESAEDAPLWKFHEHTAAVKALAWDPHVPGVLATGGGTQDKHIRFWNVLNGNMLNELDTGSQVCNLIWSRNSHELVSTHGFSSTTAQNQICIWKYPALSMVASLTGHTHRVLYLAMSPEGETIVTGAGDETLRFWNAFPKKGGDGTGPEGSVLDFGSLIR